jgi:2-octaprenylphenol hydroxylase
MAALSVKPFDPQAAFEPQVSALSEGPVSAFSDTYSGVWDGILAQPYGDMQVWSSGTGQIHFSAASVRRGARPWPKNRVVRDALLDRFT